MYTYSPFPLEPPTPLGHHREPSWIPCAPAWSTQPAAHAPTPLHLPGRPSPGSHHCASPRTLSPPCGCEGPHPLSSGGPPLLAGSLTGRLESQSCDGVWKVIITARLFSCCFYSVGKFKRNNNNHIRKTQPQSACNMLFVFLKLGSIWHRVLFLLKKQCNITTVVVEKLLDLMNSDKYHESKLSVF